MTSLGGLAAATRARLVPGTVPGTAAAVVVAALCAVAGDEVGAVVATVAALALIGLSGAVAFRWGIRRDVAAAHRDVAVRVMRDGGTVTVLGSQLVVGDLVALEPGDVVAAPARCLEGDGLLVDAVPPGVRAAWRASSGDLVDPGTVVRAGRGVAEVVGPVPVPAAPSRGWAGEVGGWGWRGCVAVVVLALAVVGEQLVSGLAPWRVVVLSAAAVLAAAPAAAVAAVLVAVVQTASLRRLARRAVAVDAVALERVGGITLLVTDKSGTLTDEGTSVVQVWSAGGEVAELARVLVLCVGDQPDPTDLALLAWARSLGIDPLTVRESMPRVAEVPYDAGRRRRTTASDTGDGFLVVSRGAPEAVWPMLVTSRDGASTTTEVAQPLARSWAVDGLRVLAVATTVRRVAGNAAGRLEWGLRLQGLIGLAEEPLSGAREAVADLADLGVDVALVTGDHRATALTAATRVGILDGPRGAGVVTGEGLEEGLWSQDVRVGARIGPEQRAALVTRWREAGEVVAVNGLDVDDAAALRLADVGVCVGRRPVEAVRQATRVVVEAEDLEGLVGAVRESRRAADTLRRGHGVLAVVAPACAVVAAVGAVVGSAPGLTPAQVLVVTLVVGGLPVLAFAREPLAPAGGRRRSDHHLILFPRRWWQASAVRAAGLAAVVGVVAAWALATGQSLPGTVYAATAAATLGIAAAGRSPGIRGRAAAWVTSWLLVAAGCLVFSLTVRPFLGADGIGPWGVVVAVAVGLVAYAVSRGARLR